MLVMSTVMLYCEADRKESCYGVEDGCDEPKCKEYCVLTGHTKGSHCPSAEECCCFSAAKPNVNVVRRRD
ncbi:hypothetical protein VPH35_032894 [Triticum aestivum]